MFIAPSIFKRILILLTIPSVCCQNNRLRGLFLMKIPFEEMLLKLTSGTALTPYICQLVAISLCNWINFWVDKWVHPWCHTEDIRVCYATVDIGAGAICQPRLTNIRCCPVPDVNLLCKFGKKFELYVAHSKRNVIINQSSLSGFYFFCVWVRSYKWS